MPWIKWHTCMNFHFKHIKIIKTPLVKNPLISWGFHVQFHVIFHSSTFPSKIHFSKSMLVKNELTWKSRVINRRELQIKRGSWQYINDVTVNKTATSLHRHAYDALFKWAFHSFSYSPFSFIKLKSSVVHHTFECMYALSNMNGIKKKKFYA